jgi:hypothetical protein
VSSRFFEKASGAEFYREWTGEVRNVGSKVYCLVQLTASFKDSSGTEKANMYTFADAPPFLTTSKLSTACIAPGARGAVYANDFGTTAADPSTVRTIAVTFSAQESADAVPDPAAPTVTAAPNPYLGGYQVKGTLRATDTVYNIGLDAYPIVGGIVHAHLSATNLNEVAKDATWAFDTTTTESTFVDFLLFPQYIRGPKTAFGAEPPANDAFAAEAEESRAFRSARADRLAVHLQRTMR